MTDSACLIHGFSYASAIPNDSKQGNPMHVLGESISFGRYMDESLDWEKFSTFSHKKYVEEAERYAKPGSVAQKKAFFEAHYKKIAAQKAAALLDQANKDADNNNHQIITLNSHSDVDEKIEEDHTSAVVGVTVKEDENIVLITQNNNTSRVSFVETNSNDQFEDTVSMSEGSGIPQIERPLLKNSVASEDIPSVMSKKRSSLSILKSSIQQRTWRVQSTEAKPVAPHFEKENNVNESTRSSSVNSTDKKRSSPKSLRALINLIPIKEQDKQPILAKKKTESSFKAPKDCSTPLKTPIAAAGKSAGIYPIATPQSENKRIKTPTDDTPSAIGNKTSGPKWHLLSAVYSKSLTAYRKKLQSPTSATPFILRTEERASKRKQKLEEKFKAEEVEKVQLQKTLKEKAGNEFRKLGCGFCFKGGRTLPDFHTERETPKDQKKTPATSTTQQAVLGRSISNKKHGTVSMPPAPAPAPPTSFTKNGVYKNLPNKNAPKPSKFISTSLPDKFTHGKASSNIR